MDMRLASTAVSVTTHVMLIGAALWASVGAHPRAPQPPIIMELGPAPRPINETDAPIPAAPVIGGVTIPIVPLPRVDGGMVESPRFTFAPRFDSGPFFAGTTPGSGGPIDAALAEEPPVMLAGPSPVYPDLLRQAGIQGRVLLEAVVDTGGHVEPGSIVVVTTAHPGFVAPAQQALRASLFRPARVRGTAVRVRVRMAFDFVVRDRRL